MKAILEHVVVDSLAACGLPEVNVKYTVAEWQLIRKFIRMAREHMDVMESELNQYEGLVYKRMMPIFMEIDEKVSKSLEEIAEKSEAVNMDAVRDWHRYDWTEELNQNVATPEEIEAMKKEAEEAMAAAAAAQQPQPPQGGTP